MIQKMKFDDSTDILQIACMILATAFGLKEAVAIEISARIANRLYKMITSQIDDISKTAALQFGKAAIVALKKTNESISNHTGHRLIQFYEIAISAKHNVDIENQIKSAEKDARREIEGLTEKDIIYIYNKFISNLNHEIQNVKYQQYFNISVSEKLEHAMLELKEINKSIANYHASAAPNEDIKRYSKETIWEASKRDYLASRSEGNRFASLNILSRLLPSGYIVQDRWEDYGKTEGGEILPLHELLDEYAPSNVSVIGEGGIGKTTFLLKLMEGAYEVEYDGKAAVHIFIELNRCPVNIGEWILAKTQQTNFITRYVAAQISTCEFEDVPRDLLKIVDDEFKKARTKNNRSPDYLILLDGFNEVNRNPAIDKHGDMVGSTVRQLLSNEIEALMDCPNVRVIMTSRKMDKAYFSGDTKNIELTGVKREDIRNHLNENNYREADINAITSSFKLMECLRIPLFLCMFTVGGVSGEDKPTTRGEILHSFFNQPKGMYTERETAERINITSSLTMTQTWFILDFVLPYIGCTLSGWSVVGFVGRAKGTARFLKYFKGYLHTDSANYCHSLSSDIVVVGCLSHARRKFNDALKSLAEKDRASSKVAEGKRYCDRLFDLECEFDDLSQDKRYKKRQEFSKPLLEEFFAWTENHSHLTQTPLGKAVHYLLSQRSYLQNFPLDGRLEISNNRRA